MGDRSSSSRISPSSTLNGLGSGTFSSKSSTMHTIASSSGCTTYRTTLWFDVAMPDKAERGG